VVDSTMRSNAAGRMIEAAWSTLPSIHANVAIDALQIMPNHVHGILVMRSPAAVATLETRRDSLADVVRRFKTYTTRRYIDGVRNGTMEPFAGRLWQRNYYERVVRDDDELERIRTYVAANPARWSSDRENPYAERPIDP